MATDNHDVPSNPHEGEQQATRPTHTKKKRKRKNKNPTISQFSIRDPPWAYLHLKHHTQAPSSTYQTTTLDETTVSMYIDAALNQFLGVHGRAVPTDILKLEGSHVWVRIPNLDRPAFMAALSGWVGRSNDALRVVGWSSWDANALGRDAGQTLFND